LCTREREKEREREREIRIIIRERKREEVAEEVHCAQDHEGHLERKRDREGGNEQNLNK
jgi:hypothetical protein